MYSRTIYSADSLHDVGAEEQLEATRLEACEEDYGQGGSATRYRTCGASEVTTRLDKSSRLVSSFQTIVKGSSM